jgi:hypothetical protein
MSGMQPESPATYGCGQVNDHRDTPPEFYLASENTNMNPALPDKF